MNLVFPAYLVGLLALGLPWLLHRFSDQQAEEQPFPSNRFLEPTTPPASRTRHLKYRALLALRVLSLLLLCLLFAQPWLARQNALAAASRHHIIAMDQSLSMRAEGRWDTAQTMAREILDELPAADSVELVGFDTRVRRLGSSEISESNLRQSLSDLQPGYIASDYGVTMQALNALAVEQDVPVKLWMITDVQKSALPAQINALYAPQVSELQIRSVVTQVQGNVYLKATALSNDGVNVQINAQLLASESAVPDGADEGVDEQDRSSEGPGVPVTVQVSFDDQVLTEQRVIVNPGELETLLFDGLLLPPGNDPVFTVSIAEPDALMEDNRNSVIVKVANPMPVVLLQSERAVSDNASIFLGTALETDSMAQVQTISGNAERVPPDSRNIISGRNLTLAIGLDVLKFVDTDANALIFRSDEAPQSDVQSVQGSEMGLVDAAHPLSLGQMDWFGTRFFDVPPIKLLTGDRVLLQTSEQQPILIERPVERGRLLILNDRLDGVSSNLPLQPVFIALMQSMLRYFDASTALPDEIVVGNRLALPAQVQVLDPDDEPLLTLSASGHSGGIELSEPGLYTVIGVRGEHSLQVVLDSREADLTTVDPAALDAWQSRHLNADETASSTETETDAERSADRLTLLQGSNESRWAAWQLLLPLLVLALLMEGGFANRRLDVRRDGS